MASKVLVLGSPAGRFREAFTKIAVLHRKNSFALCLVTGDLCAPAPDASSSDLSDLLSGAIPVPLPTYFTVGTAPFPAAVVERLAASDSQLCENLFFLGRRGALTTSEGIRIAFLGGALDSAVAAAPRTEETSETKFAPFYTAADAATLRGVNSADLLVTTEWPAGVGQGSAVALHPDAEAGKGRSEVAQLASALRPRYHFVPGGDGFWEREPYRNSLRKGEGDGARSITRFLAVAAYGNATKAKSLYAFSINPSEPSTAAANTTRCPYADPDTARTRKRPADGNAGFFWGEQGGEPVERRGGHGGKRGRGARGAHHAAPRPPPGPENCFFCLSYPRLEKHLIVSIGNECYLTTAKGPLTSRATNPPELPFSSHVLIIPLEHAPTLGLIEDAVSRRSTRDEMHRYRLALENMFARRGCGAVTFEVSRRGGVHAHWQVVPVRKEILDAVEEAEEGGRKRRKIDAAFDEQAKKDELPPFVDEEEDGDAGGNGAGEGGDFFRLWISGRDSPRVLRLPEDQWFDLQFGRRVLAGLLGCPNATFWKDCVLPHDEEARDAAAFKEAFKEWDFSLEGGE